MMPIAFLMVEHRLIERMIKVLSAELARMKSLRRMDSALVLQGTDFLRNYADKRHHGKEEDILFRLLAEKKRSEGHVIAMAQLINDHIAARKSVGALIDANTKYAAGTALSIDAAIAALAEITDLYPKHISKEDREFFIPVMKYFSAREQESMIEEFKKFDSPLAEEAAKYKKMVEDLEKKPQ